MICNIFNNRIRFLRNISVLCKFLGPFVKSGNKKDTEAKSEGMTSQLNIGYRVHCIVIYKPKIIPKNDGDPLESEKIEGFPTS